MTVLQAAMVLGPFIGTVGFARRGANVTQKTPGQRRVADHCSCSLKSDQTCSSFKKPMICVSVNRFFMPALLSENGLY